MKAIEITFRIIGIFLTLVLGWGFGCPMLVSARHDLLVVVGFVGFFIVPLIAYFLARPIYKAWKEQQEKDIENYGWKKPTSHNGKF